MTLDIDAIEARAAAYAVIPQAMERTLTQMLVDNSALCAEVRELRAANERLTAAASGRGMVSEMDGLPEIAVLVIGLHERAERAEAANMAERQEWSKFYTLMTGDEGAYSISDLARAIKTQTSALAQARALLARVFPQCCGHTDTGFCRRPAKWRAEWSDRSATVCDEHRPQVQKWYDGDHEYDKTGFYFEQIDMADELATALSALSAPDGASERK